MFFESIALFIYTEFFPPAYRYNLELSATKKIKQLQTMFLQLQVSSIKCIFRPGRPRFFLILPSRSSCFRFSFRALYHTGYCPNWSCLVRVLYRCFTLDSGCTISMYSLWSTVSLVSSLTMSSRTSALIFSSSWKCKKIFNFWHWNQNKVRKNPPPSSSAAR